MVTPSLGSVLLASADPAIRRTMDGLFGTLLDADGNIIQIIELSASYLARQDRGEQTSENRSA